MKKGFTLIELLAVILILGIIALIAIPTVNNILKEAQSSAFKASANNIIKTIEEECQISFIKGENPVLSYTFSNNKSNEEINIKGKLPKDGYIFLNNECEVTNYYLTDNKVVYSNEDDIREEYMLMKPTGSNSIFKTLYPNYYDNIINVSFVNNINIPGNAIEIKDVSLKQNNNIKSWLIPNGEYYNLYVGSNRIIYANYNSSSLFKNLKLVTSYDLSNFDTSFAENLEYMFYYNSSVTYIDVSNFNTSNVTKMNAMFYNCHVIDNLDVSNFDTSKVTTMGDMFCNCYVLTSINLLNFDTSNVNYMYGMFNDCCALQELDLSNFNTSKVVDFRDMFSSDGTGMNLTVIKGFENFDTKNVQNMDRVFANCRKLKSLNLSKWNTSSVTNMSGIFEFCFELIELDISSFNTSNVVTMNHMFNNCIKLTSLDVSHFDTSKVNNMYAMFSDLKSISTLDVSNFNTSNVTDMRYMFDGLEYGTGIKEIKGLENFDFSKVEQIACMFANAIYLKKIEFINANNSSLSAISMTFNSSQRGPFHNCIGLEYIDLGNLDMTNVSDIQYFFQGLTNIKTLKYNHASSIKRLIEYFPTKDTNNVGTLLIDDRSKLLEQEINVLNSKNWNVV